jgi:integrase
LRARLVIVAPARIDDLVGVECDRHLVEVRRGKTAVTHLLIPAHETKTGVPFEVELPPETSFLLARYREVYLPRLADQSGPYLFPNDAGLRRHTTAMSVAIKSFISDEIGLTMNVHLCRHLAVKLLLDVYPDDIETARRLLGHRSSATTSKAYAEHKTITAFRRLDGIVARHRGTLPDDIMTRRGVGLR